jgi:hypothetical protein
MPAMIRLVAPIGLIVLWSACGGRARIEPRCEWTAAGASSLERDAMRAEDLAIRYADATAGRRSGRRAGPIEYQRVRNACASSLFTDVARAHHTSAADVAAAASRRPRVFDTAVMLSFAAVYTWIAIAVAGWIETRFGESQSFAIAITIATAVAMAVGGLVLGDIWSAAAEIARVGNDHLSYRGLRVPWLHHEPQLFAGGVAIFFVAAAVRSRRRER